MNNKEGITKRRTIKKKGGFESLLRTLSLSVTPTTLSLALSVFLSLYPSSLSVIPVTLTTLSSFSLEDGVIVSSSVYLL